MGEDATTQAPERQPWTERWRGTIRFGETGVVIGLWAGGLAASGDLVIAGILLVAGLVVGLIALAADPGRSRALKGLLCIVLVVAFAGSGTIMVWRHRADQPQVPAMQPKRAAPTDATKAAAPAPLQPSASSDAPEKEQQPKPAPLPPSPVPTPNPHPKTLPPKPALFPPVVVPGATAGKGPGTASSVTASLAESKPDPAAVAAAAEAAKAARTAAEARLENQISAIRKHREEADDVFKQMFAADTDAKVAAALERSDAWDRVSADMVGDYWGDIARNGYLSYKTDGESYVIPYYHSLSAEWYWKRYYALGRIKARQMALGLLSSTAREASRRAAMPAPPSQPSTAPEKKP